MLPVPRRFSASRRFPHLSWAWPSGSRELLVIAAGHADEHRAVEAFVRWLATTDIDGCAFPEQRLLVRIAGRFPEARLEVAERARLNGIVRHLWTKSRLALDNARPVLRAFGEAGVQMLVLKGMALTALDMQNLKGRIAHDIDVLVRATDLDAALAILDGAGWRSTRGESGLFLKQRGASFRSLNFVKPPFGDIDLHTRAYLAAPRDSAPETGFWARSTRAELLGVEVRVPSATDRLVNAIAHGVPDAHRHSDWLVDCAQLVGTGDIDWPLALSLSEALAIPAQMALALFCLREMLGCPVPETALAELWEQARSRPVDYFKALLLGYPRERHSLLGSVGRRLCKIHQAGQIKAANAGSAAPMRRGAAPGAGRTIKMRRVGPPATVQETPPALRHRLSIASGARRCSILVGLDAGGHARRYVFEINTSDRHVARLRFKDLVGRDRLWLGTSLALPADIAADDLWIEARQSGILPGLHSAEEQARFGPRPFRLVVR